MLYEWRATDGKEISGRYFVGPGTPPAGVPVFDTTLDAALHVRLTYGVRSSEASPVDEEDPAAPPAG